MEHSILAYVFVGAVAAAVSMLTLFAGFGLGTLLMPAFALFFPIEVAVAATAVVHAANGLFKVALLWKHVVPKVLVRFGLTAVAFAFLGAFVLTKLARGEPVAEWQLGPLSGEITAVMEMSTDVTELKMLQHQLRASQRSLITPSGTWA